MSPLGTRLLSLVAALGMASPLAAAPARTDSASVDAPRRIPYRSPWEEAAALPGRALYLIPGGLSAVASHTATLIWEQRILDRMRRWLTFHDDRVGVRPLSNTLQGTGARVFVHDLVGGADAQLLTTFGSSRTRQHAAARLTWPGGIALQASYRSEPSESYYGLGMATRARDKTSFRQRDTYLRLSCRPRRAGALLYDGDLGYHGTRISAGAADDAPSTTTSYPPGTLPGLHDRLHFVEAGVNLRALFVDVPGSPSRGHRTRLRLAYRQSIDDDEYSMLTTAVVSEQFLELYRRRTVSVRLGGEWRRPLFDDRVPFYDMALLGGTEVLRGYRRGRFRDRGIAWGVAAYKFPVWDLVEGTVFWEEGRTFRDPADLDLRDWQHSWGGGLRVWVPKAVLLEVIVARSAELTRVQFTFDSRF